jgi:hypothetical protein
MEAGEQHFLDKATETNYHPKKEALMQTEHKALAWSSFPNVSQLSTIEH